jgi:hypothetical protein
MPKPTGPQFSMPSGGLTPGEPSLPLYRYINLHHGDTDWADSVDDALVGKKTADVGNEVLDRSTQRRLGSHWTHDFNFVKDWADYHTNTNNSTSVILEASHPGAEHIMDWSNPRDKGTLEDIVVSEDFRDMALPEVSIRPGTPMNIRAVHVSGPDPTDKFAPNILHRLPITRQHPA